MQSGNEKPRWILTATCPSGHGQVAAVSGLITQGKGFITEFSCFDDELAGRFFIRCVFYVDSPNVGEANLRAAFAALAANMKMEWTLTPQAERMRLLLMVSQHDHCLRDLLYRVRIGELPVEIVGIVSNHETLAPLAAADQIPFHHLPVSAETKPQQEAAVWEIIEREQVQLVVLARYMQVLSDRFCARLQGRAINIHHSFLPGFKGARPYHQAYERGVKIIGATAHYVTADLDEGPIIEQVVERVGHAFLPEELKSLGRDMECRALARAVRLHTEHRIFLSGNRTVILG